MKHDVNFDRIKNRMAAFFAKDYDERCCMPIMVPKESGFPEALQVKRETTPEAWYLDFDTVLQRARFNVENTIFLGDAFPAFMPYFGTAGHVSYMGETPSYVPNTIWFEGHHVTEPDAALLHFDRAHPLLQKHLALTKQLVDASTGTFFIAMNDNCGAIDALSELRGAENLLIDMMTEPDFIHAAREKILDVWRYTNDQFFNLIYENNQQGSAHAWMQTWTPGRHMQLQCDFSVMISPQHYEAFVLPELEAMTQWLDHANYHLDGQEQIRHLDMILSVAKLDNIQWTPVAGQPNTSHFLPELKRIQQAGKGLILMPDASEVEFLLENLSHKALLIIPKNVTSPAHGEWLLNRAEQLSHA